MRSPSRTTLAVALAFVPLCVAASALRLPAQTDPDKDCQHAAKIVAKGHPAKKEQWAFLTLSQCGAESGSAYAAGLATYATETDAAKLGDFMEAVDNWRDSSIMGAATALAINSGATPQARVFAIRHLIGLLQPNHAFTYAGLAASSDTTTESDGTLTWTSGCQAQITSERHGSLVGTSLPSDFAVRIRASLSSLAASSSAPAPVRNAAHCVLPP